MERHCFVIPAYKESPYLEVCVQHLLEQTVRSRIVITTSTPNKLIETIVEKYGLEYYVNHIGEDEQKIVANNWNFALSKASAELVTLAHQDDIYEPDYTETILSKMAALKGNHILLIFTGYKDLVNGKERNVSLNAIVKKLLLFPFLVKKKVHSIFFKKAILVFGSPIGCPTVTLNMELLKGFSFSTKYNCIIDWFAWYEIAKRQGAFLYINKPLMLHRIHLNSETSKQIKDGGRTKEEKEMFTNIWGKPIAKIISSIYTLGHKQNKI